MPGTGKRPLQGEHTVLRGLTELDRAQLVEWRNNPELKRLTGPGPFLPVNAADIELADSDDTIQFAICAVQTGELAGWIALTHIVWTNRCAQLAVYLGETADRGRAWGSDAIRTLLDYAFNELNLHKVELEVVAYNEHAKAAYRKLGFALEGTKREHGERQGQRYDLEIYGLLASEFRQLHQ